MGKNKIDYYLVAPFSILTQKEKSIKFEKENGESIEFNNKENKLTLEILCKNKKVEINDKTSDGKPVDINLLNDFVNKGFLVSCMDLFE